MVENELVQLSRNGRITLPNSTRKKANLSPGSLLQIEVLEGGRILLSPVVTVDRTQAYFWSSRWQAGEQQAEKDLLDGRFQTFETIEEFIADLNAE